MPILLMSRIELPAWGQNWCAPNSDHMLRYLIKVSWCRNSTVALICTVCSGSLPTEIWLKTWYLILTSTKSAVASHTVMLSATGLCQKAGNIYKNIFCYVTLVLYYFSVAVEHVTLAGVSWAVESEFFSAKFLGLYAYSPKFLFECGRPFHNHIVYTLASVLVRHCLLSCLFCLFSCTFHLVVTVFWCHLLFLI